MSGNIDGIHHPVVRRGKKTLRSGRREKLLLRVDVAIRGDLRDALGKDGNLGQSYGFGE
jgi:hypothetical protein